MFKAFGNLLHKTPWWGLILFGLTVLAALTLFATPVHVLRLSDSGATPEEQRAIKREIRIAFGDSALNIAEEVIAAMKKRSSDDERNVEFDKALSEIAHAREELSRAQTDLGDMVQESAQEARLTALEAAQEAAQSALDAATDARQAVEEARDDSIAAVARLKDKGVDASVTAHSFDKMIEVARGNEKAARDALAAIEGLIRSTPSAPPAPPAPPQVQGAPALPSLPALPPLPAKATSSTVSGTVTVNRDEGPAGRAAGIGVKIDSNGKFGVHLPPEFKGDIRSKVAGDVWRIGVGSVLILTFVPLFIILLLAKYFIGRSRKALAFAQEKEKQAEVSDVSRQITEARLQALQAQVEPHFLYNTLANVQALTEIDPPAANLMVGHLIQYLRAALPKMRESTSTVGQELELVRAYLNILKMRMGDRLAFDIDAPEELLARSFPPMMLPSLVENAIKHGLEPVREGGRIDVVVSRSITSAGEQICIEVKDTGRGLSDAPMQSGGGVGLTNVRERLAALYGGKASFALESNTPRGVVATLRVPYELPVQMTPGGAIVNATPVTPSSAVPQTGWNRVWNATSKTHSVWARVVSRTFVVLLGLLVGLLVVGLLGLYLGWMPVQVGDLQLDGIEGMALGSIGLLFAFGVSALVAAIVVAVIYGLGFLFAALLIFIPAVIVMSIFPVMAPFLLIWALIYWFWWRKRP